MSRQVTRHQFTVVIDGVELGDEVKQRINGAIQQAAVSAIAEMNLQGDFRFHFPMFPRPEWWGLWLRPIRPEQLEKGGFEEIGKIAGPGF